MQDPKIYYNNKYKTQCIYNVVIDYILMDDSNKMSLSTADLLKILESKHLDSSDFILIALDILKHKKRGLSEESDIDELIEEIKVDYMELNYPDAIKKLIEATGELEHSTIGVLLEAAAERAALNNRPEQAESRRYFENRLVNLQWNTLDNESHYQSLERLALFMSKSNADYAEKQAFSKLEKIQSLDGIEAVIAAMRGFGEETASIREKEAALRMEDKLPLSKFKDRGSKRNTEDVGFTLNPGIIRANSPIPIDERRPRPRLGSVADSFVIDSEIPEGYSARNVAVPFVNSLSGTTYTLAAVLQQYIEENRGSPHLQQDIDNITQAFVAFTCKSGFHSMSEMIDVIHSPEVSHVFEELGVKMHYSFYRELDDAIDDATDYLETRQSQKTVLQELTNHDQFKRHAEPTAKASYPTELMAKVSEKEQSGARVAAALMKIYSKKQYSPTQCRELAQQYLNYAKINFPKADMKAVNAFLKKMNDVLQAKSESLAQHMPKKKSGTHGEKKLGIRFFKQIKKAAKSKKKGIDPPDTDDSSKENDTSMLY